MNPADHSIHAPAGNLQTRHEGQGKTASKSTTVVAHSESVTTDQTIDKMGATPKLKQQANAAAYKIKNIYTVGSF